MKLTRTEYEAIIQKHQANQMQQLKSIPGGAYRVTLSDMPGFIHRSLTDQTLLGESPNREQSLHNFHVAEVFTLAFFDKHLKRDQHTYSIPGRAIARELKIIGTVAMKLQFPRLSGQQLYESHGDEIFPRERAVRRLG